MCSLAKNTTFAKWPTTPTTPEKHHSTTTAWWSMAHTTLAKRIVPDEVKGPFCLWNQELKSGKKNRKGRLQLKIHLFVIIQGSCHEDRAVIGGQDWIGQSLPAIDRLLEHSMANSHKPHFYRPNVLHHWHSSALFWILGFWEAILCLDLHKTLRRVVHLTSLEAGHFFCVICIKWCSGWCVSTN